MIVAGTVMFFGKNISGTMDEHTYVGSNTTFLSEQNIQRMDRWELWRGVYIGFYLVSLNPSMIVGNTEALK